MSIIYWSQRAGWMEFAGLSASVGLTRTFTLAYKFTDKPNELWSERFIRFKANQKPAVYGGARLFFAAFPELLASLQFDPATCAIVSALSSGDTVADLRKPLPFIADQCAKMTGVTSAVTAISKQPHAKIHTLSGGASARSAELDKASYTSAVIGKPNVFVFDDFVTRGDTLSRIARAIIAANGQVSVYGVAMAKTERIGYCPNPAAENSHVPLGWNGIWAAGEVEARAAG